jgi:lariat debranching enzyme
MPAKYRKLNTFQDYVTGAKVAPVTTIFIGGNHEASNLLQELYYGGWVAPNIYFLGFAGVVWFGGIKIAGLSGIFNDRHYSLGHYERPPYSEDAMRSVYHLRELEVYRMSHMANSAHPVDIFLSHDW